ncbi:RlmE family RNA methyltransferase [Methanosphaera sp. WGK6]|uniref:RlmE family RNA methyltransferase n=1 Tax=Methanosphaera sp. WGK6 TaxID=1561964 RepID=UPI00084CB454|nr:RlmE family RNA methyltransferase [Methanosphaera sp. WGK6]OED30087.1 23S rRNA methyltransferase [Methanosphaera sp. WGK6]
MSRWKAKHDKEHYYKLAKKQNYRSRASYKIKQLDKKYNLLKPDYNVVDLGAAPGGWSQVVADVIGEEGTGQIISVDLEYIKPIDHEAYTGVKGDFTTPEIQETIIELIDGKADVILSDASPKLTGIKDIDNFKAYDLAMAVIDITENILKNEGNLIMKAFQGEAYQELIKRLKKKFRNVKTTKPNSSRKRSAEMYVIARGFKGGK